MHVPLHHTNPMAFPKKIKATVVETKVIECMTPHPHRRKPFVNEGGNMNQKDVSDNKVKGWKSEIAVRKTNK